MEDPDLSQVGLANHLEEILSPSADAHDHEVNEVDDEESDNQQSSCNASFQESTVVSPAPSDSTTTTDNCDNSSVAGQGSEVSEDKPTSTAKLKNTQANSSDDDDDDEDDPDFDPTTSTNTPQENLSEEDSDGEVEEGENHNRRSNSPGLPASRKRPASEALGVNGGSLVNKKFKARKLVSVNSSRPMTLPPGIPRARITFLSGKPSDIGLADLRKTGLSGVLAALRSQKQTKLTTLEKSRHDWQAFKQAEGLEDELRSQLKSRNGFLEKRDFLERTDHRQFEKEKEMRTKHRRNP